MTHNEKLIVTLGLVLLLSACGGARTIPSPNLTATPIEVVVTIPYDCGVAPATDPVRIRDVHWDSLSFPGNVALTMDDYKLLGLNTSDIIAAARQLKEQRDFYRDCIARSQKDVAEKNLENSLDKP